MPVSRPGRQTHERAESALFAEQLQKINADRRKAEEIERMIEAKVALALKRLLL